MEISPVAKVDEDVLLVGERRLARPVGAFAAHLREGGSFPIHPLGHVMAADPG